MSTRKGEIIFLEDVLNEAKERALESIKSSPSMSSTFKIMNLAKIDLIFFYRSKDTKISEENFESVADILGTSGILIHDMSNRRVKEYKFNWNSALRHFGDTGIALQYTHARLCKSVILYIFQNHKSH
jgi:arginyl-tRNA synthetase